MEFTFNGYNYFFIIVVCFIATVLLVPIVKKIAYHVKAIDIPNERKVHKVPMPRLGGLAIFFSFLLGYFIFSDLSNQMLSVLIGSFILIMLGFIDDINPLRARYKLIGQVIAALIVVFYGNITLSSISFMGLNLYFGDLSFLITIVFIVGIINAINLIDGLDGLASGVSSIYFMTVAIIAIILNRTTGLEFLLSLILTGSTLGFLVYNFAPASIFMGDTGSMFLGFMIAIISLLGFKTATLSSIIIPIVILGIPIYDTLLAILRRIINKQPIGYPDKQHLHHQFLKLKFTPLVTVLIIYGINILFSIVSIFYVLGDNKIALSIYLLLMIVLIFIVLKTDILYIHKEKYDKKSNKII